MSDEATPIDAAKSLIGQLEETYHTLGGVLYRLYAEGIYRAAGYDGKRGFANYVEKELGLDYRKAMYLINNYTAQQKLPRARPAPERRRGRQLDL